MIDALIDRRETQATESLVVEVFGALLSSKGTRGATSAWLPVPSAGTLVVVLEAASIVVVLVVTESTTTGAGVVGDGSASRAACGSASEPLQADSATTATAPEKSRRICVYRSTVPRYI